MRLVFMLLAALFFAPAALASPPGLPKTVGEMEAPPLADLLGFEPGTRHPQPHELVDFYRKLADASPRVRVETIGRSHGGREHILVYFARPERLERIEEIRAERIESSRDGDGPPVIWLGYS